MPRLTEKERATQRRFMAKRLRTLEAKYLDCRDPSTGHNWKRLENFHVVPASTEGKRAIHVARKFQCERCTTVKREIYIVVRRDNSDVLERVGMDMDYPTGYLMPGVPRGVKRAEIVRAEQYRRALEKAVGAKRGERVTAAR
jgi:hypothetical protein